MELKNPMISLSRQCDLLGMNRSSFYYRSRRNDTYNDLLMRLIDEQYTRRPTLRSREDEGLASKSGSLGE